MKRINFWALVASGLLSLPAVTAYAADDEAKKPEKNQTEELFKKLDKNGDSKLVPDEIPEEQGRFFDRLVRLGDKDDNGELTRAEFDAALQRSDAPVQGGGLDRGPGGPGGRPMFEPKQMVERLDKNKDGKLTKDELPEDGPARFLRDMLERTGKDSLTADDLEKAREWMQAAGGQPGQRPDQGGFFKQFDKNGDGKLTKDELPEPMQERFSRFFEKAGKEGLSADDIRKAFAELGSPGGPGGPGFRPNPEEMFKRLDANSDGKVSLQEVPAEMRDRVKQMFERAKKDELTLDDVKSIVAQAPEGRPRREGEGRPESRRPAEGDRKPEGDKPRDGERRPDGDRPRDGERRPDGDRPREGDRRPDGPPPPREGDRRPDGPGPRPLPRFFQMLDRNKDGRISRDELDRVKEMFQELDMNKDGQLDPPELLGPPPEGGRGPDGRPGPGPDGARRPDGDRPREGDRRPPEGDRPREGQKRPEGDRPREGERRPPEGDRPREGQRRPEGDRPREGERRPEGDRPRDGEKPRDNDRPRDGEPKKV